MKASRGSSFSATPSQAGIAGGTGLGTNERLRSCQPSLATLMCPPPTDAAQGHHWSHGTGTARVEAVLFCAAPPPPLSTHRNKICLKVVLLISSRCMNFDNLLLHYYHDYISGAVLVQAKPGQNRFLLMAAFLRTAHRNYFTLHTDCRALSKYNIYNIKTITSADIGVGIK